MERGATTGDAIFEDQVERAGRALAARLEERRAEIEETVLDRAYTVEESRKNDHDYAIGLRTAISGAFDYGIALLEWREEDSPPIPPPLVEQARRAARRGVSLDTVLRRYFAGSALFSDFIMREAAQLHLLQEESLRALMQRQAAHLDRLVVVVSDAYDQARREWLRSPEQRHLQRVNQLLAGETSDGSKLAYDLGGNHVALIVAGRRPAATVSDLAAEQDRLLLVVEAGEQTAWAWLGGRREFDVHQLQQLASRPRPADTVLALGEPAEALEGWRLSHRQAQAALAVARRHPDRTARYGDVAVLAAMLHDEVLGPSLDRLFLKRLDAGRIDGAAARTTLRAYFGADCNVSSAAAALGVNRHTVTSRLKAIEKLLGRSLTSCRLELDAALQLEGLGSLGTPASR